MLRTLLNVLWIIFGGGFIIWLEYVVAGVILCITVIGIPFGVQCFKVAGIGLLPFGKDIQRIGASLFWERSATSCGFCLRACGSF
jgi:uncharacterized membrane protein YccF (DUF307 family)